MVRRRDGAAYRFDIGADDDVDATPGRSPGDARPTLRERVVGGLRGTTRRQRVVAAGTALGAVLAVAGGVAITTSVQAHQLAERLRASPGGVVSLPASIAETWDVETRGGVLAVLPDGGILTPVGDEVVAVDVADGTERWRVEVGAGVDCGPRPRFGFTVEWTRPSAQVVCLVGPEDARTVTVIDADGTVVGRRALDNRYTGEGVLVAPAANAALAVLERSGPLPERIAGQDMEQLYQQLEKAWARDGGAVLRLEDALTGETLGEASAPFLGVEHVWHCLEVTVGPDGAVAEFDSRSGLVASPAIVQYDDCGVEVALMPDGERFDAQGSYWRFPYPDGGYAENAPFDGSRIVDASGEVLVEVPGWVIPPNATDGSGDDVVLAVVEPHLVAFQQDGSELWRTEFEDGRVLVRTAGVIVLDVAWVSLVALDVRTGEELWRLTGKTGAIGGTVAVSPLTSVVTDGATALVSTVTAGDGMSLRSTLVRLDLATGETAATGIEVDGMAWLAAVDGNVLVQTVGGSVHEVFVPDSDIEWMADSDVQSVRGLGPA